MLETVTGQECPSMRHTTKLRVPLFEVDLGQAVYHGNYFHLLELAREEFLRSLGYSYKRFMDDELHLTVVESAITYRKSLHYDEQIDVQTSVLWWRRRSLAFLQEIMRDDGKGGMELCTKATVNVVCVRFTGQPTLLPEQFMTLLKGWMNDTPCPCCS